MQRKKIVYYYSGWVRLGDLKFLDRVPFVTRTSRPVAEIESSLRERGYTWFSARAGITIDGNQYPGCQGI